MKSWAYITSVWTNLWKTIDLSKHNRTGPRILDKADEIVVRRCFLVIVLAAVAVAVIRLSNSGTTETGNENHTVCKARGASGGKDGIGPVGQANNFRSV